MKKFNDWKLFPKLLFLTSGLGILPLIATIILFEAPISLSHEQFKLFLGTLLMTIPVATFCIATLISSTINSTLHTLLKAQRRFRVGDFRYQIPLAGDYTSISLFRGFNAMTELVHQVYERLLQQRKNEVLTQQALQIVHDLAGPLHSINVARDYLVKMKSDDQYFADHMQLLELGSKRLSVIADGLLKKYKDGAENKHDFALQDLLQKLISEYRLQAKNVEFLVELPESTIILNGQQTRLERALGNIIKNAIEAMQGKGVITISAVSENSHVNVSITDNGPGMSEATLQKVLQGGHTEGKTDGHGIGTKVIREVVKEFGGSLCAESALGQGTTFMIHLPLSIPK